MSKVSILQKCYKRYKEFMPENITKNINSNPYDYDPFLLYLKYLQTEKQMSSQGGTAYSDRLIHQDIGKYNSLCMKHFGNEGQWFDQREPDKIEAFLSDWIDKKVVIIAIIQYVNLSNGFPYWRFDYYIEE